MGMGGAEARWADAKAKPRQPAGGAPVRAPAVKQPPAFPIALCRRLHRHPQPRAQRLGYATSTAFYAARGRGDIPVAPKPASFPPAEGSRRPADGRRGTTRRRSRKDPAQNAGQQLALGRGSTTASDACDPHLGHADSSMAQPEVGHDGHVNYLGHKVRYIDKGLYASEAGSFLSNGSLSNYRLRMVTQASIKIVLKMSGRSMEFRLISHCVSDPGAGRHCWGAIRSLILADLLIPVPGGVFLKRRLRLETGGVDFNRACVQRRRSNCVLLAMMGQRNGH